MFFSPKIAIGRVPAIVTGCPGQVTCERFTQKVKGPRNNNVIIDAKYP